MYFKTNLPFAGILVSIDSWNLVLLIQAKDLWSKKLYVGTDLYNYQERKTDWIPSETLCMISNKLFKQFPNIDFKIESYKITKLELTM